MVSDAVRAKREYVLPPVRAEPTKEKQQPIAQIS
jgi:hypothetical protein